ncbi:hypothetical protein HMPREF1868_01781 [Olsenella sp. DNF00959]|nr:hypothetical protein HMPREF1868_01781 [Olsenella sp. DNF00959]
MREKNVRRRGAGRRALMWAGVAREKNIRRRRAVRPVARRRAPTPAPLSPNPRPPGPAPPQRPIL